MGSREVKTDLFTIHADDYGWCIKHNESGRSVGINYKAIPEDSSDDFIIGYATCLAYQEGWVQP